MNQLNWWSDLGGLLGRGIAWTPFDYFSAPILLFAFILLGATLGRYFNRRHLKMHLPYAERLEIIKNPNTKVSWGDEIAGQIGLVLGLLIFFWLLGAF